MAEMSKYCKAYEVHNLRKFSAWTEDAEGIQQPDADDGNETSPRTELKNDDFLYIHDNYKVTDGIFKDQNIIFDKVTDAWKKFCTQELGPDPFIIPVSKPVEIIADPEGS